MIIYFTTRKAMRTFVSKGKAKGLYRKPIDNGTYAAKRWACDTKKANVSFTDKVNKLAEYLSSKDGCRI